MQPVLPLLATIPSLFAHSVTQYAELPAVATERETLSYEQLDACSRRYARAMISLGVGKGSRLALLAPNGLFFVAMYLASARVGAVLAPISTLSTAKELAYILRHCDAQYLFACRRYQRKDYGELVAAALPSLKDASHERLALQDAPFLRGIWFDDAEGLPWAGHFGDLVSGPQDDAALSACFLNAISDQVTPADEAVVIYTSGSTADPKAVVHGHGGVARHGRLMGDIHCLTSGHRVLPLTPMFWVGGLDFVLAAFTKGGCLVFPEGASAESVAEAVVQLDANFLYGWPASRNAVRDLLVARGASFTGIRGLDPSMLPPPEQVVNPLGMTESFGPHSAMPVDYVLPPAQRGASGPAVGDIERRIVDLDTGDPLPAGEVGELQLRGGSMMLGYYKKERSETFTNDGFFPTRDLGCIEPDGFFYFKGRSDDMLKSRGANVSRLEVENFLRQVPEVAEVVVCGVPAKGLDQRVVAAVVLRPGAQRSEADLIEVARQSLSSYKVPRHIVFVDRSDLMWSASGKIRIAEMGALIERRLGLA